MRFADVLFFAGCSDVVKKPKLDQHRFRCNASFTCIDCSKTFPTPADWKGHTSCISEAEKYQKSLYKPKNGQDRGRNANFQGRNGKFNNGNNASWNKGTPRSQATGANGTPLGTPIRMSPVTTTENEAKQSTPDGDSKRQETSIPPSGQKRKAVEMASDKPSDEVKEEIKSSKKRKSDAKEVDHTKTGGAGADILKEVNSEDNADAGKKKKDRKVDEINGKNEGDSSTVVETDSKVKQKKEKKHKKNEVSREGEAAEITDEIAQVEDKGKREENSDVKLDKGEKKKKKKSTKKDDGSKENNDENVKPDDVLTVKKEEKKKKKVDKDNQDEVGNKDMHTEKEDSKLDGSSPAKIDKEKSKKSKKRKHAENDEETSEKVDLSTEKRIRKKD